MGKVGRWLQMVPAFLAAYAVVGLQMGAQESDTAVFSEEQRSFPLLSEIEDAAERQAFLSAYDAQEPVRRHARAQSFVETYPRSWLLAQAYDLAARSSIDLTEYRRAATEAGLSLRLIPENPILLTLIANVETQIGDLHSAQVHARDGLFYLDWFARVGRFNHDEWQKLRPRLKASAYFALGRAFATQGMSQADGAERALSEALDALNHAAAWNPQDLETIYLRGLVELSLRKKEAALRDLAYVARSGGVLSGQALTQLRGLSQEEIARIEKPVTDQRLREDSQALTRKGASTGGYAGSAACRACHTHEYETWSRTGMAQMLRPYAPENLIGDFSERGRLSDAEGGQQIRLGIDSRPYFEVADPNGRWRRFPVDYTIGSKWQQAYATRLPDGRLHVFPIEYNVLQKAWINYWKMIDPPGSERARIADFGKLTTATNYQQNCAVCHTSQLRVPADEHADLTKATFLEPGVNCEMCHGPSASHAEQRRHHPLEPEPAERAPIDFRKVEPRTGVEICAQCHMQSAMRQIGHQREMNFSTEGRFFQSMQSRPFELFSRRAFYKDGRFRETTFLVEAFVRSACYRRGGAQCATCHAPHVSDFRQNTASLKFAKQPDEMCLSCHAVYRTQVAGHTHHRAGSEASQCVSCHMPKVVNALLFQARSHQIEIPTADLSERFGQSESPNVCLTCHRERDEKWASQALLAWKH